MWLFYTIVASSFFAFQTLLRRKLLKENNRLHHVTVSLTYLSFSCLATMYALVFHGNEIYPSSLNDVMINILLGGVLYATATSIDTFVASHVDAVVSGIVMKLSTVTVIIGGALILQEYLTTPQLVGAVAIMASSLLLVRRKEGKKRLHVDKFTLVLIADSIIFGLAAINEKYTLGHINLPTFMIFGWGAQTLCICLYALVRQLKLKPKIPKGYITKSLLLGVVQFFGASAYIYALVTSDNQPLVVSTMGIGILITAIGAVFFLHETDDLKKKSIAAVLGILGIIFVAFG